MNRNKIFKALIIIIAVLILGCKKDDPVPEINIFPGERIGDLYLGDNMETTNQKLVAKTGSLHWIQTNDSLLWLDNYYWNEFNCDTLGMKIVVIKQGGSVSNADIVDMILVYEPFKACTDKRLQLGSLLTKVSSAYGIPDYIDPDYGDYYYDKLGIGFYADGTKNKVGQILIYKPGYFQNISKSIKDSHNRIVTYLTKKMI